MSSGEIIQQFRDGWRPEVRDKDRDVLAAINEVAAVSSAGDVSDEEVAIVTSYHGLDAGQALAAVIVGRGMAHNQPGDDETVREVAEVGRVRPLVSAADLGAAHD